MIFLRIVPYLLVLGTVALTDGEYRASLAPLRVIRATPEGSASPHTTISVSFDRPVAGSLERTVDPVDVLTFSPAIEGRFEWRDPVTLRFIPSRPLVPDLVVTVIVTTAFSAMDGSRLEAPHQFTFRIRGPRVLATSPSDERVMALHVVPGQQFDVVFSDSVNATRLSESAFLEMSSICSSRIVRLRVGGQRGIGEADPWNFRGAGGWTRDAQLDSLRRVVSLFPRSPIPRDCAGDLVIPEELSSLIGASLRRVPFRSYGPLKLSAIRCRGDESCPRGPVVVTFSNPVSGAHVQRNVRLIPAVPFVVRDTAALSTIWTLDARLTPRTAYALAVDPALRDQFGQSLTGNPAMAIRTTGYEAFVSYPFGKQTIERNGIRTLPVEHVNADTLIALIAPVPTAMESEFLARYAWGYGDLWDRVAGNAETKRIPTKSAVDRGALTGIVMPVADATRAGSSTLYAVKVGGSSIPSGQGLDGATLSLIQVTDLGVTARVGVESGAVWVTGLSDGRPRAGAAVTLHAADGAVLTSGVTDSSGLALLRDFAQPLALPDGRSETPDGGYVAVRSGADRALVAANSYDPDLSAWAFGVAAAWGGERFPFAGAVFSERGIYRPGERVHLKAIIRTGPLGALRVPVPSDTLRWVFSDREGSDVLTKVGSLSEFGTAQQIVDLPPGAPVGTYQVRVLLQRRGGWHTVARTSYRVGEYRPPEFLVDASMQADVAAPGAAFKVRVSARYLFGAPMARAAVVWEAREERVWPWELEVPGTNGWQIGRNDWGWNDADDPEMGHFARGADTLDARGERTITVPRPRRVGGVPARVIVSTAVTDVNRQSVGATVSTVVHPAQFYVAARVAGSSWFWRANEAQRIAVRAVRPDGTAATGVQVTGLLIRREWHRVRRERDGVASLIGEWVTDTVSRCGVVTTLSEPPACALTPVGGGVHKIEFSAADVDGNLSVTSFSRWVSGEGFVPWSDETQFKMDLFADRERYSVGDTATVLLASPFTDAEAWLTVEREEVLRHTRLRITSGAQTVKIPITEAFAPNAFVSVVVVRGRSASPGPLDDPGRPTMRVGYVELRVTPEVKRLAVNLALGRSEYRPGDSAQVKLEVRDSRGLGVRSEVALWAVDEGVLSLTGYKTPDPLDLIYRTRALGIRLSSNLVSVTPQVPEGEKGRREAGGGGGAEGAEVLRSRFTSTAFFLGEVVTDDGGNAQVSAKLPDNLTTFRVMAVAVTKNDRYGSGQSPMLVTRPVVARPAIPRFVRPGDSLQAGTLVNRRDGASASATVKAVAEGVKLLGPSERTLSLGLGQGSEARFRFVAAPGDSATFRFDVRSGDESDAVRVSIPVKPDHRPRSHTIAGVLRDSTTVFFRLPADIDPARSLLTVNLGSSPLTIVRGIRGGLRVYEYECTEQISSRMAPLLAMLRAGSALPEEERAAMRREVARGVRTLIARQRADGGIGYWGSTDWTTPWLSAYAAELLIDAREVGVSVDSVALERTAEYLRGSLRQTAGSVQNPFGAWYDRRSTRLADQVAAAEALGRLGTPDIPGENELLRNAAQMAREDRIRLAELVARRGAGIDARRLLAPVWAQVKVEGRTATLPADTLQWYFQSRVRETARLLTATLAVDPGNALIGPLVERLVVEGRSSGQNTQDLSATVRALEAFDARARSAGVRRLSVRVGGSVIARSEMANGDTSVVLGSMLGPVRGEFRALELALSADGDATHPTYFYLTVTEIPLRPPVRPSEAGIRVERWYERLSDGRPISEAVEGDLVRVRLRVTVPTERRFVVLDDALPAGLEAVDLSLRTSTTLAGPGATRGSSGDETDEEGRDSDSDGDTWGIGRWDAGWWTPWEFREIRDDRVVYSAAVLWPGTWNMSYLARATTPGVFVRPPAHAEEMYNPGVNGRSDGGRFTITARSSR